MTKDSSMNELQKYFNSFFIYDAETGNLYWRKREELSQGDIGFNKRFAGKQVGCAKIGTKSKTAYYTTRLGEKYFAVHRIIFAMHHGYLPEQVDHIDHNGLNNKIENLRPSNNKDNARNLPMQKSNKSGYIGVNWHKSAKKWQARAVDLNGKRVDLGRFDNIEDAIKIRKEYEVKFKYYNNREAV